MVTIAEITPAFWFQRFLKRKRRHFDPLHRKLSKLQPLQPMMEFSSKWHFNFSLAQSWCFTLRHIKTHIRALKQNDDASLSWRPTKQSSHLTIIKIKVLLTTITGWNADKGKKVRRTTQIKHSLGRFKPENWDRSNKTGYSGIAS